MSNNRLARGIHNYHDDEDSSISNKSSSEDSETSEDVSTYFGAEDQPRVLPSAENSVTSSTDSTRGIPDHVKTQLVVDIQAAGGLDRAVLKNIIKERELLYKGPNPALHAKIIEKLSNQVQRWKTRQHADFNCHALLQPTQQQPQVPAEVAGPPH